MPKMSHKELNITEPKNWHQLQAEARKKYGEAVERPQDTNVDLLKITRRNNLEMLELAPDNYIPDLHKWIEKSNVPVMTSLPFIQQFKWVDEEENLKIYLKNCGFRSVDAISVDFEFHNKYTYDCFVTVASVSTPEYTLVVDCIAKSSINKTLISILQSEKVVKVFHGADNDLIRLKREWGCFVRAFVDLQDMFLVWKEENSEKCFLQCKEALLFSMKTKRRLTSNQNLSQEFSNLQKPGLDFLMDVFEVKETKDKLSTHADWRKRPLHPDLLKYAAKDSHFTLVIFYELLKIIGPKGFKKAAMKGIQKLINFGHLPKHKLPVQVNIGSDRISIQVMKWRDYLAVNFDKKPDQVLQAALIPNLVGFIQNAGHSDLDRLAEKLRSLKLGNDFIHGAKLLDVYVDKNTERFDHIQDVTCHNCAKKGHVAIFCPMDSCTTKEARALWRNLPINQEDNKKQDLRRFSNFCAKRGWNPDIRKKPYEIGFSWKEFMEGRGFY